MLDRGDEFQVSRQEHWRPRPPVISEQQENQNHDRGFVTICIENPGLTGPILLCTERSFR